MPSIPSKPSARRAAALAVLLAALCPDAVLVSAQANRADGAMRGADVHELRQRAAAQSAATQKALNHARKSQSPAASSLEDKLSQLICTRREIDERCAQLDRALASGKLSEAEHQRLALRYLERRLERLDAETGCTPPAPSSDRTHVEVRVLGPVPESEPVEIGRLQLANFANPAGLTAAGDNLYIPSHQSGDVFYAEPGQEGAGLLDCHTGRAADKDEWYRQYVEQSRL